MRVIIMSGISGSGKTHYVEQNFSTSIVCSIDRYLYTSGSYQWNVGAVHKASGKCLRRFMVEIMHSLTRENVGEYLPPIVIDNTNTSVIAIAPYFAIAQAYDARIEIVTLLCDPGVAHRRNIHGVPLQACVEADARLRARKLPAFWTYKNTSIVDSTVPTVFTDA